MPTVLITGAASGIGRATAHLFADAGWRCVLVDRDEPALIEVGRSLHPASDAHLLRPIDLTDLRQVASLGEGITALDAVLNVAGMSDASNTPLVDQTPAQIGRLLALNLQAPAAVVDACSSLLRSGARIVNVSSGAGLRAIPWRGVYSPTKAGLIAQTKALARARPDWCATVLAPGFVRTELVEHLIQAGRLEPKAAVSKIPLGRMASPTEMAHTLLFLASLGAWPLTGQVVSVDGGSSIYGGSQPFAPATMDTVPVDTPVRMEFVGDGASAWQALTSAPSPGPAYPAWLDISPLTAPHGALLQAVHAAAVAFAARHVRQASLTLLLPCSGDGAWQQAGDAAAARMLVSTLACEWGGRALRINALEVPAQPDPSRLDTLLRHVCGPTAQYLTGQTLICHGASPAASA